MNLPGIENTIKYDEIELDEVPIPSPTTNAQGKKKVKKDKKKKKNVNLFNLNKKFKEFALTANKKAEKPYDDTIHDNITNDDHPAEAEIPETNHGIVVDATQDNNEERFS